MNNGISVKVIVIMYVSLVSQPSCGYWSVPQSSVAPIWSVRFGCSECSAFFLCASCSDRIGQNESQNTEQHSEHIILSWHLLKKVFFLQFIRYSARICDICLPTTADFLRMFDQQKNNYQISMYFIFLNRAVKYTNKIYNIIIWYNMLSFDNETYDTTLFY